MNLRFQSMSGLQRAQAVLAARLALFWALLFLSVPVQAHPAPFSYLDLDIHQDRIEGTLTVHTIDLAHELQTDEPSLLLDETVLSRQYSQIGSILGPRLSIGGGDLPPLEWTGIASAASDDAVRLRFVIPAAAPPALDVAANLFPYDPQHQTFVNVREYGQLVQQWILAPGDGPRTHFAGTAAGVLAVLGTFIPAGVHHILIGPDHILFVIGLILLGGSWRRLALIVTAFTLGHSVTLSLAALGHVVVPASIVEPLIALSIVVVGADNLLRAGEVEKTRDLRPLFAVMFGLIHGFGFAYVLADFGLPQAQLAWSLFGFNLGVEIGQLAIVLVAVLILGAIRRRNEAAARRVATIGSLAVVAAGAYWFIERVFLSGGA